MNENRYDKPNEVEIDLKELVIRILQKWPVLLLCMVLCAGALIGWKVIRGGAAKKVNITPVSSASEYSFAGDYQTELTLYKNTIDNYGKAISSGTATESKTGAEQYAAVIERMQADNERDREYLEKSIRMSLPEEGVYGATADIVIQAEEGTDSTTIGKLYQYLLTAQSTYKDIAAEWGTSPPYVAELIWVESGSSSSTTYLSGNQYAQEVFLEEGKSLSLLHVTASQGSEEKAKELLEYALAQAENRQAEFAKQVANHSMTVANHASAKRTGKRIVEERQQLENKVALMDALTERYEGYKAQVAEQTPASGEGHVSDEISAKQILKLGIIGFVAGLVFGAFLILLRDLFTGTIYSRTEISQVYGLRLIAALPKRKKGEKLTGLAGWLEMKKESSQTRGLMREQRYGLAAANLHSILTSLNNNSAVNPLETVGMVGVASPAGQQELCNQLQKRLPSFHLYNLGKLSTDAEQIRQLNSCEAAVLVIELDVNRRDVEAVIRTINNTQVVLAGVVVI